MVVCNAHATFFRVEGVNDQSPNAMTLHTSANCNMPASRSMTGSATGNNCDVNTSGNTGCGVVAPSANSYGPSFNAAGGGFYAMERTNSFIKVWFWPRNGANVPNDLKTGASSIDTDNWVCSYSCTNTIAVCIDHFWGNRAHPRHTSQIRHAISALTSTPIIL